MLSSNGKIHHSESILETIGRTPLIKLRSVIKDQRGHFFAKLESFNPGGSDKDRSGLAMIEDAEREGRLHRGGTIVEATSGNMGIGLAIAAAVKGYKCVFTIPDKTSQEKIQILRAYGAEVIVTPAEVPHDSPESYIEVAKRIVRETPNSILANQFYNPIVSEIHARTTGPELWEETEGQIDYFVAGIGTGGTISGIGKFLKEKNPAVKIIGVDPHGSFIHDQYRRASPKAVGKSYKLEGIGQNWLPAVLDFDVIDDMIDVSDKEAFLMTRRLCREEGLFLGGSSGAAMAGALKYASHMNENNVMVILMPDRGERYLSKIFNDNWMREHGFLIPDKVTVRYVLQRKGTGLSKLIFVESSATLRTALALLKEYDVSQLPVLDKGKSVGRVLDSDVMSIVLEDSSKLDLPVSAIMEPSFPVIGVNAPIEHAIDFLKKKDAAVLIEENRTIVGILTRYDVIEFLA